MMIIKYINFSRGNKERLKNLGICNTCNIVFDFALEKCKKCNGVLVKYEIQDGDIIEGNFNQSVPHTDLTGYFNGKNVTVRNFNGMNCDFPDNVALDKNHGGSLHFHKSFCGHNHPNRVEKGDLPACPEVCDHVDNDDPYNELIIDGESTGRVYNYVDIIGR